MCSISTATAACSPKDIYMDSPKEQGSWLKKVRHSGEYSNVSIVVDGQIFHLHMLPLVQESIHLRELFSSRGISKDQPPGTEMAIELPAFPGGAATFAKAMDFCYSIDVSFSSSNVASIIAASKYLEMANLLKKAEDFLEKHVYRNWRNCLQLWTTIDQKEPYVSHEMLNDVMRKCERSFKDCVVTRNDTNNLWCNIRDVAEMVYLSSAILVSRIFQTLSESGVGLYYAEGDVWSPIVLYLPSSPRTYTPLEVESAISASERATWKPANEKKGGEAILWLKKLPSTLTSEWQRAMFVRYIGEWMLHGMDKGESPVVLEGFLLTLLVEANKLVAKSTVKQFPCELTTVINRLKTFRSIWLGHVNLKWLANSVSRSELDQYPFEVLQVVVRRIDELHGSMVPSRSFKKGTTKESFKENIAKIDKLIKQGNPLFYADKAVSNLEDCVLHQLKNKTLSVEQVLSLIQDFPPSLRSNHEGLYRTLEHVTKIRALTAAEQQEVNKVLDYRKVSDEVVKSAFRHPKLGFSHSLLNRAMELEISKLDRVKVHYDQDDDSLSTREKLVRSRKCHLILEKALRTHMRASILLSERTDDFSLQMKKVLPAMLTDPFAYRVDFLPLGPNPFDIALEGNKFVNTGSVLLCGFKGQADS
ncbi:hypothetical protein R1sor_020513 [Riccia sorocarpa]|uniref:BTB domain-containing protein n=1 Tax=Riccia sorocarpa TaxID=122646 RepID=A0ABD3IJV7_9MARC